MTGLTDSYIETNATFAGQTVLVRTLAGNKNIQKVYFRLPDGGMYGDGYDVTGSQSLLKLYFGSISSISNTYGTAAFSLSDLVTAIGQIITIRAPASLSTLDYMSDYGTGDHADHQTLSRIVASTQSGLGISTNFAGYVRYNLSPSAGHT